MHLAAEGVWFACETCSHTADRFKRRASDDKTYRLALRIAHDPLYLRALRVRAKIERFSL
jgi:hypothetical protein